MKYIFYGGIIVEAAIEFLDRYDEFICRGKDEDGNWLIGVYVAILDAIYFEAKDGEVLKEVDPMTKGQRIKVSAHGTEDRFLFEGDIVDDGRIVTLVGRKFNDDGSVTGMSIGWYIQRDNFESWDFIRIGEDYTVHGNIHDDPNLPRKIRDKS